MKQKFENSMIVLPIGLFILSGTMAITHFATIPDIVSGFLLGIGIGLIAFAIISKRIKQTNS